MRACTYVCVHACIYACVHAYVHVCVSVYAQMESRVNEGRKVWVSEWIMITRLLYSPLHEILIHYCLLIHTADVLYTSCLS